MRISPPWKTENEHARHWKKYDGGGVGRSADKPPRKTDNEHAHHCPPPRQALDGQGLEDVLGPRAGDERLHEVVEEVPAHQREGPVRELGAGQPRGTGP